jgi:ribonucleoside-diphosphate reductase alpha chain
LGFAELCILLGISYDSTQALQLADELMTFIQQEARLASVKLAEERGAFPNWALSNYAREGMRLRNATQTSIAPTGTISIIAGTSSGIEPLFALAYRRQNVLGEQTLSESNPLVLRHLKRLGLDTPAVLRAIASSGRIDSSLAIEEKTRKLFVTALEIPPERHVQMQAAFQRHVDNAVSKTANLPSEATPSDVAGVYGLAYQLGCKGITVFRYGSKSERALQLGIGEKLEEREYFTKCDPGACRL